MAMTFFNPVYLDNAVRAALRRRGRNPPSLCRCHQLAIQFQHAPRVGLDGKPLGHARVQLPPLRVTGRRMRRV